MRTAISDSSLAVVPLLSRAGATLQHAEGPLRPFLLLAAAPRDQLMPYRGDLAVRLHRAGHAVTRIDLAPDDAGRLDVDSAADEVAALIDALDLRGRRAPVAVGQGLGAAVALSLGARRGGVAAVACIDGGWSRTPGGTDPRALHPLLAVPLLLCASLPEQGSPDLSGGTTRTRAAISRALRALPAGAVHCSWYPGGSGDIPSHHPGRLAEDLLALADRAEPGPTDPHPVRAVPGAVPGYLPLPNRTRPDRTRPDRTRPDRTLPHQTRR